MGVMVAVEALIKFVDIRIVEEAHVLTGHTLDDHGALAAQVLISSQRAGGVTILLQAARQRISILQRHDSALGHERQSQMAGVSQQRYAVPAPARHRIAVKQPPAKTALVRADQHFQVFVPVHEVYEEVTFLTLRRPGFRGPVLPLENANAVHQLTPPQIIVHKMSTAADPVGRHRPHMAFRQPLDRDRRPPSDAAGKAGRVGAEETLPNARMYTIASDQHVPCKDVARCQRSAYALAVLLDMLYPRVQLHCVWLSGTYGTLQHRVKIGAVQMVVGIPKTLDTLITKGTGDQRLTGLPMTHSPRSGRNATALSSSATPRPCRTRAPFALIWIPAPTSPNRDACSRTVTSNPA